MSHSATGQEHPQPPLSPNSPPHSHSTLSHSFYLFLSFLSLSVSPFLFLFPLFHDRPYRHRRAQRRLQGPRQSHSVLLRTRQRVHRRGLNCQSDCSLWIRYAPTRMTMRCACWNGRVIGFGCSTNRKAGLRAVDHGSVGIRDRRWRRWVGRRLILCL